MLTHCPRNSGSKLWGLMPIQSMTMWSHCLPDPVAHGHSPRVISCSGFLVLVAHCNLQENSSSPVSLPTYVCCMSVCARVHAEVSHLCQVSPSITLHLAFEARAVTELTDSAGLAGSKRRDPLVPISLQRGRKHEPLRLTFCVGAKI